MGQTRTDIAPWVRHKVGLPSNDQRMTDEKVFMDINTALRKMANDFDWPWLVQEATLSFTEGTANINLPADHVKTLWAAIENISLENVQRRHLQLFSQLNGAPRVYSVFNGKFSMYPKTTSDVEVSIAYIRSETFLADDSDEVLCPDPLIDIIYTYAALETANRLKDAVLRNEMKDELNDWKRRAADNVKTSKGSYAPQTGRVWA